MFNRLWSCIYGKDHRNRIDSNCNSIIHGLINSWFNCFTKIIGKLFHGYKVFATVVNVRPSCPFTSVKNNGFVQICFDC